MAVPGNVGRRGWVSAGSLGPAPRRSRDAHHVAGPYLASYAAEMDWREDNRRISNGERFTAIVCSGVRHPVSRQWKSYWQRGTK